MIYSDMAATPRGAGTSGPGLPPRPHRTSPVLVGDSRVLEFFIGRKKVTVEKSRVLNNREARAVATEAARRRWGERVEVARRRCHRALAAVSASAVRRGERCRYVSPVYARCAYGKVVVARSVMQLPHAVAVGGVLRAGSLPRSLIEPVAELVRVVDLQGRYYRRLLTTIDLGITWERLAARKEFDWLWYRNTKA